MRSSNRTSTVRRDRPRISSGSRERSCTRVPSPASRTAGRRHIAAAAGCCSSASSRSFRRTCSSFAGRCGGTGSSSCTSTTRPSFRRRGSQSARDCRSCGISVPRCRRAAPIAARSSCAPRFAASRTSRSRSTTTWATCSASARTSSRTLSTSNASAQATRRQRRRRSGWRPTGRSSRTSGSSIRRRVSTSSSKRPRDCESEAKQLVSELGLNHVVRFVPFTQDTANLYQASDVVVAPSRGPELGRPVIESAASGVPVVASGSRTGGGVVVPGETGVLVDDFGVDTLADAVEELLRDGRSREGLGHAAREHAEENFDPGKNARRIEGIYRRIAPLRERIPILYVHHRPQLGGAPSSLAQLIANLDDRFEPHVFCPEGPAADLFAAAGATVHTGDVSIFAHAWDSPYEGLRWLVLGREVSALPRHLRQLERLMRAHHFPLVHLNDSPLLPAARVAHRHGAKVVWHLRSALAGEGRDRRSRAIALLMERWGDAAIAIDTDVAARFPIHLPVTIVHNSVSIPSAANGGDPRRPLDLPEDRVAIGFAGFVRRQKGWPELVEAAEILVADGLPAHFVIMGGGVRPPDYFRTIRGRALQATNLLTDEESAIKDLVAAKGLEEHFSFLPFTAQTGEIYAALDIVTFPNQGVGLGRPVLEAAMYGKPVVASGSREGAGVLIPGETGLLLDDASPQGIAAALRLLIQDPELRESLGDSAAEHARLHFDPRVNARAVEAVYDSLLGTGAAEPAAEPVAGLRA